MSKVYVVQQHFKKNRKTGELEPTFDLSPAEKFGELSYLLSPSAAPWASGTIVSELREKLSGLREEDHILLVGNPVLIALTAVVASEMVDTVTFLQWSGKDRDYIPIKTQLYEE